MAHTRQNLVDYVVAVVVALHQDREKWKKEQDPRAKGALTKNKMTHVRQMLRHMYNEEKLKALLDEASEKSATTKTVLNDEKEYLEKGVLVAAEAANVRAKAAANPDTPLATLVGLWDNLDQVPGPPREPSKTPPQGTDKAPSPGRGKTPPRAILMTQADIEALIKQTTDAVEATFLKEKSHRSESSRLAENAAVDLDLQCAVSLGPRVMHLVTDLPHPYPGMEQFVLTKGFQQGQNTRYGMYRTPGSDSRMHRDFTIPMFVLAANYNAANYPELVRFLKNPLGYSLIEGHNPFKWKLQSMELPDYRELASVYKRLIGRFNEAGKQVIDVSERPFLRSLIAMYFMMHYGESGWSFAELRVLGSLDLLAWASLGPDTMALKIRTGPRCPMSESARAHINRIRGEELMYPERMELHYGEEYKGADHYNDTLVALRSNAGGANPSNGAGQAAQTPNQGGQGANRGSGPDNRQRGNQAPRPSGSISIEDAWDDSTKNHMRRAVSQGKTHEDMHAAAISSNLCFNCLETRHVGRNMRCTQPEHALVTGFHRRLQTYAAALVHLRIASK